jgi:signal transduction histidine kinase
VWSAFRLRMESVRLALWKKVGSAFVIGCGIASMHYTAMAAASFAPGSICTASPPAIEPTWLATTIAGFSLTFQATVLFISALYAYSADRVMRQSDRKLVEMQENERRTLARELHDRVGQDLTALGINLEILKNHPGAQDNEEFSSRLDDSIALVEATADAIDNVLMELRPPMLDEHGLLAALQWLAKQFSRRTGIDVAVRGMEPAPQMRPEVEIALFRIAQEALTNVAKHANAQHVELLCGGSEGEFTLSVIDDGVGMATTRLDGAAGGQGIMTMKERAEAVGGGLELSAVAGGGTQVKVRVPF